MTADTPVVLEQPLTFTWFDAALILAAALAVIAFIRLRLWRLPAEPIRPPAFAPAIGFALYLAQVLAAVIGAQLVIWLLLPNVDAPAADGSRYTFEQQVLLQAGAYALHLLVAAVYFIMVMQAEAPHPDNRPCRWRTALLGVGALLLAWPVAQTVGSAAAIAQSFITTEPIERLAHDTLRQMLERPTDGWVLAEAALVIGLAPLLEEVLYRGTFQETLRRLGLGPWPAIIGTSVFFAAMHITVAEPHAIASLVVLSIGFGWVYERTGRLTACITMHALFNAANLAIALLLAQ